MISPDIKVLMRNMDSRYTLVVTAAKRARQLTAGAEPLTRFRSDKPVTLAIHEIAEGKVEYFRDAVRLSDYDMNINDEFIKDGAGHVLDIYDSDVYYNNANMGDTTDTTDTTDIADSTKITDSNDNVEPAVSDDDK